MVRSAAAVDWTVVGTEVEALQLEYSWIKEFDPRFNVRYRDDKSYPYLAVTHGRGVPAGHGDARREAPRGAVLRPVLACLGDPGDRGHAAAGIPGADLLGRGVQAGRPDRPTLPARLHRQVLGAVRRPGRRRRAPRHLAEEFCDFMAGQTGKFIRRLETEMRRAADAEEYERAARLRDDIQALQRALEKQAVVLARRHRLRRHRAGRRPARGRRAGVLRARRPGARAARLGGRQGRGRHDRASWSSISSARSTARPGGGQNGRDAQRQRGSVPSAGAAAGDRQRRPPRRCRARCWCRCCRPTPSGRGMAAASGAAAGSACGYRSGATRGPCWTPWPATPRVAGAAQDQARQRPDHPQPCAQRDPGGARPRRGAAADRVLRRFQPAGHARRGVHGRFRGRPGPQVGVPPVRDPRRWTAPTTSPRSTRSSPAGSGATWRSGRRPASSTSLGDREDNASRPAWSDAAAPEVRLPAEPGGDRRRAAAGGGRGPGAG